LCIPLAIRSVGLLNRITEIMEFALKASSTPKFALSNFVKVHAHPSY
jgi:hypothetical protein